MTRNFAPLAVVGAIALGATAAHAQGAASNADIAREGEEVKGESGVAEIHEVVRGFSLAVDVGPNYYLPLEMANFVVLGTPFSVPDPAGGPFNRAWFTPGTRMDVRVGFDILNNLTVDAFLLANFNKGYIDVTDVDAGNLSGDLAHFAPGLGLRFAFLTLPNNDPDPSRFFMYVRVGAGYAFWVPQALAQNAIGSIHTDASLGVEYYTKLRHLSVGAEVDFQALLLPMAFGFSVYPTVKYTFGD